MNLSEKIEEIVDLVVDSKKEEARKLIINLYRQGYNQGFFEAGELPF